MTQTRHQMQQKIATIVVSRPGVMQQSLRAILASYPWLSVVASSGDGLSALRQTAQHHPDLLVIDANLLDEEVDALIVAVKADRPGTRCLVFLYSSQREASALAAGADAVLQRNSSAQRLHATLAQLMQIRTPPE